MKNKKADEKSPEISTIQSTIDNISQSNCTNVSRQSSNMESELHKEVLKLWQKNQHNNIHVLIDKTFSYRRSCIQIEKKQFLEIFTEFPYLTFADYVL